MATKKSRDAPSELRLVDLDECEIHSHPRLAKVWQRRGCPVKIPATGEDHKFAVFGALDYATGQIIWQLSLQKDGTAFVAFLDHLVASLPAGPLVIVLDNVGYHKGRLAKNCWMAHRDQMRPLRLPAYAPQLNLMERVWGYGTTAQRSSAAIAGGPMGKHWRAPRHACFRTSRPGSTSLIQVASP